MEFIRKSDKKQGSFPIICVFVGYNQVSYFTKQIQSLGGNCWLLELYFSLVVINMESESACPCTDPVSLLTSYQLTSLHLRFLTVRNTKKIIIYFVCFDKIICLHTDWNIVGITIKLLAITIIINIVLILKVMIPGTQPCSNVNVKRRSNQEILKMVA